MPAPLAAGYREEPMWSAGSSPPTRDPGRLPPGADVVVVGGGYCGLAAAAVLAERGREVVVLEREQLGWGASTRNGGMVLSRLKGGPTKLAAKYGSLGLRLWAAANEAFDFTEALIAEQGIDCAYRRSGRLGLAHDPRLVPVLRAEAKEAIELGLPARFVPREDLGEEVGSEVFHGGLVLERGGGLDPAQFHAGLVRWAAEAGAALHPRTPANEVARASGRFRVDTPAGTIDAGAVLVAANAYIDGLVPPLQRRVLPVGSFIVATEPLPAELAAAVSPNGRMFVDTRTFLHYWRLSPDRRIVFGGRHSLGAIDVPQARDRLYHDLVRFHPQLDGVPIDFAWGGDVAMTVDRLPHVGEVDGVLYATGCNGSGVAMNPWLGVQVARHLLGDGPLPPFAELRHRPIPLWRLRRAWMPVVGGWWRWRDRHPRRGQAASAAQKSENTST